MQQLLHSPRPLVEDERCPPALAAFIDASSNIPSEPEGSFILRQYGNPNAYRHNNEGNDESTEEERYTQESAGAVVTRQQKRSDDRSFGNVNDEDLVVEAPQQINDLSQPTYLETTFTNPLSPFGNIKGPTISSGHLGESFMDLDAPSENLWGLGDFLSDNWGDLLPDESSDPFDQS